MLFNSAQLLLRNWWMLIVALNLFLGGYIFYYKFNNQPVGFAAHKMMQNTQKNITESLTKITAHQNKIATDLIQDKGVNNQAHQWPTFIYINGHLSYWSDHQYVPDYFNLAGTYYFKVLAVKQGRFIVTKKLLVKDRKIYELFTLLPIYTKYQINNKYLKNQYNPQIFELSTPQSLQMLRIDGREVFAPDGSFLFSLEGQVKYRSIPNSVVVYVVLWALALLLITAFFFRNMRLQGLGGPLTDVSLLLIGLWLFLLRAFLLGYNLPFSLAKFDLFDPCHYASGIITPSLGDLLSNVLCATIFGLYFFVYARKTQTWAWIQKRPAQWRFVAAMLMLTVAYYLLKLLFSVCLGLNVNSQWSFDISSSLSFNYLRTTSLVIYLLLAVFWFLTATPLLQAAYRLLANHKIWLALALLANLGLALLIDNFIGKFFPGLIVAYAVFVVITLWSGLPLWLRRMRYKAYIYLFLAGLICAYTANLALIIHKKHTEITQKRKFASQLLTDSDALGEYLLNELANKVKNDAFIKKRLLNPFSSKSVIEQKIKKVYLPSYFNKYDVRILVYNNTGQPVNTNPIQASTYQLMRQQLARPSFQTDYPNIYFINDLRNGALKRYMCFIEIRRGTFNIGKVIVDLRLKHTVPASVYPILLVDQRFDPEKNMEKYNYAFFDKQKPMRYAGKYNYESDFDLKWLNRKQIYETGLVKNGYHHIALREPSGQKVVVSAPTFPFVYRFANFSFFFIIMMLVVMLVAFIYILRLSYLRLTISYATQIQIYLNIAFLLPLLVVSIAIISVLSQDFRDYISKSYIEKTETVVANLSPEYKRYLNNKISLENLFEHISDLAQSANADINLFDKQGRLVLSSQPSIYEKKLLAPYINYRAGQALNNQGENQLLVQESVGQLNYSTVYMAIKTFDSGQMIGVVSVPIFQSNEAIEKRIINIITIIINIFTSLFMVFLAISYFASQILVEPLNIIARKLRRTTLLGNEPLHWESDDEIGRLVKEYNIMLQTLDQNRKALASSEKESAWREMAKQVAHEIKNPLTPMKLKLQYMQHTLPPSIDPALKQQITKTTEALLQQVETLSDIATSFSSFAKMPVPEMTKIDLETILQKTLELFKDQPDCQLTYSTPNNGPIWVMGNDKLMSRIISNLIINATQSVDKNKKPIVHLDLQKNTTNSTALISITDNGQGIPDEIRQKVFLPNFSTKYNGSGLGLAMAKRGINHAGGNIWFETETQKGTTFYIELALIE